MTTPDPLQTAIETGLKAAHEFVGQLGLDEDDMTDFELGVGAAIRAAAPVIERDELLRAAQEVPPYFGRQGRLVAQWLRDRAAARGWSDGDG